MNRNEIHREDVHRGKAHGVDANSDNSRKDGIHGAGEHKGDIHSMTRIVPWQESWERTFAEEKCLITDVLTDAGLTARAYHVGSTSVQGMVPKPITDILLCPGKEHGLPVYIQPLEGIGYECLGECGMWAGSFSPREWRETGHSTCTFAMRTTRQQWTSSCS